MPQEELFNELIRTYSPLEFACAYGSGVFSQGDKKNDRPMIDFIFAVTEPDLWHRENIKKNPEDYSASAKRFGILKFPFASIYYNPFVNFHGTLIKYGVISKTDLVKDLREWTYLYVAGRLQKPVKTLKTTPEIEEARTINLRNAVNISLLLEEEFSREELYQLISSLSYFGDPRVGLAEDKNKISNIVLSQLDNFDLLYNEALKNEEIIIINGKVLREKRTSLEERLERLPINLKKRLKKPYRGTRIKKEIKKEIASINRTSAFAQMIQGIYSGGILKASKYFFKKLQKARN